MLSDGEVEPRPTKNGKSSYKLVPTLESQGLSNLAALSFILSGGDKARLPAPVSNPRKTLGQLIAEGGKSWVGDGSAERSGMLGPGKPKK